MIDGGTVEVGGESVLGRDGRALRGLRGKTVSYVPQDPGGALNPSLRIGDAILDVLRAHRAGAGSDESVALGARAGRARLATRGSPAATRTSSRAASSSG